MSARSVTIIICGIITGFLGGITGTSFIMLPLTDDLRVFIGAAHQAVINSNGFPLNIDLAWELKPLGNRIIWYAMESVSWIGDIFTPNHGVQLLSLLAAIITSAILGNVIIRGMEKPTSYDYTIISLILLFSLILPYNLFLMQSEWWATLLAYIVLWLLLEEKILPAFMAGLISVFICSIKLSTVFLIPAVLIAYLLFNKNKKFTLNSIKIYLAGIAAGLLSGVAWLIYLPHAIPDILFAMNVAHTARGISFPSLRGITLLLHYMIDQIIAMPVLFIGVISFLCMIIIGMVAAINKDRDKMISSGLIILLWIFPLVSIYIQNEFFAYHYMILALPAVVTILLFAGNLPGIWKPCFYIIVIANMLFFWGIHCSTWSPNAEPQQTFWNKVDRDFDLIDNTYHITSEPEVLYLNSQDPQYWFKVQTACRYVGSLPLLYNMTSTSEYRETIECIENYHGTYAIALGEINGDDKPLWWDVSNNMPKNFLPNYTRVMHTANFDVYQRTETLKSKRGV